MVNDEQELNENVPGIDEDAVLLQSCDITKDGPGVTEGSCSTGRANCPTEVGGRDNCTPALDDGGDSVRGRFVQFNTSDTVMCCSSDVRL